jgi:hypothetical protein
VLYSSHLNGACSFQGTRLSCLFYCPINSIARVPSLSAESCGHAALNADWGGCAVMLEERRHPSSRTLSSLSEAKLEESMRYDITRQVALLI